MESVFVANQTNLSSTSACCCCLCECLARVEFGILKHIMMKRFHASALWVVDVGCECISSGLCMLQKASRADLWYFAGILGRKTKTSFLGLNREWQLESDRLNSKWSHLHMDWELFTTQEKRSNKRLVHTQPTVHPSTQRTEK